jgi:hypothetical protein
MPAPQFHLTFAELCGVDPQLDATIRDAMVAEPRYLRLGAIFHDLPYYTNMITMAVGYGLGRPAEVCPWGVRVHSDRAGRFARCFVESIAATEGLTAAERVALVAGFFSHVALDLTLHPLVNYTARRDCRRYGGAETHHHRLTEKYHSMFFHIERLGDDIIGSRAFYEKTHLVKRSSFFRRNVERAVVEGARGAFLRTYGDAPSEQEWTGWVRTARHFGFLVSGVLARRNSRRLRTAEHRARYYECDDFHFDDFYAVSEVRARQLIELAVGYLLNGDFRASTAAEFDEAAAIDDLAYPRPVGLPPLPDALAESAPQGDTEAAPLAAPLPSSRPWRAPAPPRAARTDSWLAG